MDEKFTIKIEIPKEWYVAQGELEIGFRVKMTKSIYYNGGGIDNFKIEVHAAAVTCRRREDLP
jgi:hypothetical protein